ncbi:hypothetical protein OG241_05910 [Streptomyces sp. NBC_01390]|uniref:hypothetical protein n=1 Tax=Streptomyces sp. NBC_01390 TaxID=2903850 RepID=UPI00324BD684
MERHFRDGHTETWWAADARLGGYGPDSPCRLIVSTTDPATLPEKATWYLATNLPHPDAPHAATSPHPPADLAEIVRLYGLRPWIEQSYKQIKDELGWADFQVRSARAIRRHQTLVDCAFSFCWDQTRGPATPHRPQKPCWPRALRSIRSWLTPATTLSRWWRAWTDKDPLPDLQALIDAVTTGHGIDLYRRIQRTTGNSGDGGAHGRPSVCRRWGSGDWASSSRSTWSTHRKVTAHATTSPGISLTTTRSG